MNFAVPLPHQPLAYTANRTPYPVGRIICIGRNYRDHAIEMGSDPDREDPFYFTKWAEAAVPSGTVVPYPLFTNDLQFEGELVVAIGREGRSLSPDRSLDIVYGYAAGLDMTCRDVQAAAKHARRPWDEAKNFGASAPLGPIHTVAEVGHLVDSIITVSQNDNLRQSGSVREMIWSVSEILSYLSTRFPLRAGDLVFTGTPAGVGPVEPGDVVTVSISGLLPLNIIIGERSARSLEAAR